MSRAGNNFQFPIFNFQKLAIFAFCIFILIFAFFILNLNEALALTGSFTPGKYGSGYDFKGADTIDIGNDVYSDVRTVSFWVKLDDTTESILELRGDTYISVSSGTLSATGFTSPTIYVDGIVSSIITAGAWHFVAVTTGTSVNATAVSLGTVGAQSLNGSLDDARFYNYALTQRQIMSVMNAGHPAVGSPVGSYVGYWDFNEMQGATAFDKSSNNNDGTITGPDWTMNGKFGGALDFVSANSDYVNCGNGSSVQITGPITVSAWVKRSALTGATQEIVSKSTNAYELLLVSTGEPRFYSGGDAEVNAAKWGSAISQDVWYHIVGTYDGSNTKVYVNGISGNNAVTPLTPGSSATNLFIGMRPSAARHFNGLIDEVKIYPFALSPAEIKQEYNQGKTMVLGSPRNSSSVWDDGGFGGAAPVAWWKMDEKTDNTCYGGVNDVCDTSANSNDGAITGAVWKSAGECKQGSCLDFTGGNYDVNCGTGSSLNMSGSQFTAEYWVKLNSTSNQDILDSADVVGNNYQGFALYIQGGSLKALYRDTSVNEDATASFSLSTGVWYHVAQRVTATANEIWINGIRRGSNGISAPLTFTQTALSLGKIVGIAYYNGWLDEVKIYNYARTQAQILQDYNEGGAVRIGPEEGLP